MKGADLINTVLPEEVLMEILRRVETKPDLDSCALVCRKWNRIDRSTRRTVKIAASGSADLLLACVIERFTGLTSVFIDELIPCSPFYSPGLSTPSKYRVNHFFVHIRLHKFVEIMCNWRIVVIWWKCARL
jgi:F-box and leucine-rich repeat protein 2/20